MFSPDAGSCKGCDCKIPLGQVDKMVSTERWNIRAHCDSCSFWTKCTLWYLQYPQWLDWQDWSYLNNVYQCLLSLVWIISFFLSVIDNTHQLIKTHRHFCNKVLVPGDEYTLWSVLHSLVPNVCVLYFWNWNGDRQIDKGNRANMMEGCPGIECSTNSPMMLVITYWNWRLYCDVMSSRWKNNFAKKQRLFCRVEGLKDCDCGYEWFQSAKVNTRWLMLVANPINKMDEIQDHCIFLYY